MGKNVKRKPTVVKEGFKRINFLYQAASITLASNPSNSGLARFYIDSMCSISNKQVLKLDPSVKRTICKCCHSLLVPGITCKVRTRAKRESHVVVTCLCCNTVKRFLSRKDYVLWKGEHGSNDKSMSNSQTDKSSKTNQKQKQAYTSQEKGQIKQNSTDRQVSTELGDGSKSNLEKASVEEKLLSHHYSYK